MSEELFAGDAAEGCSLGLFALMAGISEELYCASWMDGLESALWKARQQGPMSYGQGGITQRQCELLRLLSDEAGVWWTYPEDGPLPIPLAEWQQDARVVAMAESF